MDEPQVRRQWRQKAIAVGGDLAYSAGIVFRFLVALPFIVAIGIAAAWSLFTDWLFG